MPGVVQRLHRAFLLWRSTLAELGLEELLRQLKANVLERLKEGDTGLAAELERIHDLERRLERQKKGQPLKEPEEGGIPERLKVKRRKYTLSEAALRARRENAQRSTGPRTEEGKLASSRNAWKHGKYARSFLMRYSKPCKSTCPQYPCSIVEEGRTGPGGECLEKEHVIEAFNAILKAVLHQQYEEFNTLAALEIAKNVQILRDLQEAVLEDGVVVYDEKVDKDGNVIAKELKPHPALLVLPKLIAELGFTPQEFMATPRAIARAGREEEGVRTLADVLSEVGRALKSGEKKDDSTG